MLGFCGDVVRTLMDLAHFHTRLIGTRLVFIKLKGSLSKHNGKAKEKVSSNYTFTLSKVFHDYSLSFMMWNVDEVLYKDISRRG